MGLGVSQLGRLGRLGLGSDQLGDAGAEGPTFPPDAFFYADLIDNRARLNGVDYTGLANVAGYSFARASQAYALNSAGELLSFASGAPRITNKGLLIEGSAQNICLQSADFATTWTKTRSSMAVSGDALSAPDGTVTADKIIEDTNAASVNAVTQAITTAATTYTFSVYAKAGERTWLRLVAGDGGAYFNIGAGSTGTVSAGTVSLTASTPVALGSSWYRCAVTFSASAGSTTIGIRLATGDGGQSYTGDGASGIYVWGAQLETGTAATSYVATTSGAVTRAADVLSIGISGLSYPVTMFAEFERAYASGANARLIHLDDGDTTDRVILGLNSSGIVRWQEVTASADQVDSTVGAALSVGALHKAAARFNTNSSNAAINGTLGTNDGAGTLPATPTTIRLGSNQGGAEQAASYLRKLAIYPSAYTDAQFQVLTQ